MRKFYTSTIFFFVLINIYAQQPFITTWEVTDGSLDIEIPASTDPVYSYNYSVDFGDGTILSTNNIYSTSHTYAQAGTYTVSITGNYSKPNFTSASYLSQLKIKSIEQWGDIQWESMENAFRGCSNLVINATDAPDLSQVTSLKFMFGQAASLNQSINHWDVSTITNMEDMFQGASLFNQPLNNWDVSNVTNMKRMFFYATSFNQPINTWDVSNVEDMYGMFYQAHAFNQPLNNWNVSNITSFNHMFRYATSFNQTLNNWDVSSVDDFGYMFDNAITFNQDLSSWNTSSAIHLDAMFSYATSFNQPLDNWNVSNVVDVSNMFSNASVFNQPLSNWNTFAIQEFQGMFKGATAFNQSINTWDLSSAVYIYHMFLNASSFNQPLDNWNTASVEDFYGMFYGASAFNQSLGNWDFSNVTDIDYFVANSGLDVQNYDVLLQKLSVYSIQNKPFDSTGLEYCNFTDRDYLINNLGWTILGDNMSTNCNNISGTVLYDQDVNGCDSGDVLTNEFIVNAINSVGSYSGVLQNGNYNFAVVGSAYDVSLLNLPEYFSASPQSTTVTFDTSSTEQIDFCLTSNQTVEDLNITLLPITNARPGFEASYKLVVKNIGTQTVNNINASLNFDDTKQSFVSSLPEQNAVSLNSLDFLITSLMPFQKQEINIIMETFSPPTVNDGDVINFTATVLPNITDYTPSDNIFNLEQIAVNAFDPNDKRVLQGNTITIDQVDEYLDYIIRFQNTGSANATFVRIEDKLDVELDWSTFEVISSSHTYDVKITNGSEVEFLFSNINLPYQGIDDAGSNGFIVYKIKPKSTIAIGDFISGEADIYFDYNLPVATNTVTTEVVNNLGIKEYLNGNLIMVFPNPTTHGIHIKTEDSVILKSVKLYNVQGRLLINRNITTDFLNTEKLSPGMYLLTFETNMGQVIKKILIK
ncbi:BspA family leucine-rich repeat surface protein [Olleya sp. Ti.3.14]|uniref:BspA family leucine-rich repeat surface protein n=1 Tax=Olleya sp. Ti.3.14 TaxID=3121297 RepID=UPI003120541C